MEPFCEGTKQIKREIFHPLGLGQGKFQEEGTPQLQDPSLRDAPFRMTERMQIPPAGNWLYLWAQITKPQSFKDSKSLKD
ncbi:hypothetical protein MHJ94_11495 [Chryseobacterium taklimakanense]|uniref:hypothetical protein n=1 Tax=Chryseobacterium taklimakanense TaxID=536441 RepID=UPI001EF4E2F9|nr:hypothetical protein [Chryseobacterium taklimakanense]MCG7281914.1 hypothetical protein [Chryseobacterium taklimakanense]